MDTGEKILLLIVVIFMLLGIRRIGRKIIKEM